MEEDKVIRGNGTSERKEIARFLISCTNDCHGSTRRPHMQTDSHGGTRRHAGKKNKIGL